MSRAVFIDFDGTYADHGRVPDAHVEAVLMARANGHRVLLCTGRPRAMVSDRVSAVFDGVVCAAGGYVEIDGEILRDIRFPADLAGRVAEVLTSHDVTFILEAPEAVYALVGVKETMRNLLGSTWGSRSQDGIDDVLDPIVACESLDDVSFGKVAVFSSALPVERLAVEIGPEVGPLPNSVTGLRGHAGEIYLRGVNKAEGLKVAAAHLGVAVEDTVAIGDGHNDIEMLAHAGTAVVVEAAPPEVLALADLTMPGPARDGLVDAFGRLGLMDGLVDA